MANLSLSISPPSRGAIARILERLGRGSAGAVFRRALALYFLRVDSMSPDQLKAEALEIKAHRKTDR